MEAALGESAPLDVFEPSEAVRVVEEFERRIAEEGAYTDYGVLVNSGEYDGDGLRAPSMRWRRGSKREGRGSAGSTSACATGACRASATGVARSR
jgi:leucyl-tRNA synthetase